MYDLGNFLSGNGHCRSTVALKKAFHLDVEFGEDFGAKIGAGFGVKFGTDFGVTLAYKLLDPLWAGFGRFSMLPGNVVV